MSYIRIFGVIWPEQHGSLFDRPLEGVGGRRGVKEAFAGRAKAVEEYSLPIWFSLEEGVPPLWTPKHDDDD